MSYFSKWKRNSQPTIVNTRGRSQSLDVEALERSGIRTLQNVSDANHSSHINVGRVILAFVLNRSNVSQIINYLIILQIFY